MDINEQFEAGLLAAEADTFWCFSKLLDDVQDNFTDLQPGVHLTINKMNAIVTLQDAELSRHLKE